MPLVTTVLLALAPVGAAAQDARQIMEEAQKRARASSQHYEGSLQVFDAKGKIADLKAYMDSVKALVAQYVPPQKDLIGAAQGRGDVATAPNPSNGTLTLTVSNYLQKGDKVAITVNQATHQVNHVAVNTWLNDPAATVTLDVAFITLPNGVSFASTKTLTATAKEVVVTITDANFALAVAP